MTQVHQTFKGYFCKSLHYEVNYFTNAVFFAMLGLALHFWSGSAPHRKTSATAKLNDIWSQLR